jgi:hypothetical protein
MTYLPQEVTAIVGERCVARLIAIFFLPKLQCFTTWPAIYLRDVSLVASPQPKFVESRAMNHINMSKSSYGVFTYNCFIGCLHKNFITVFIF